MDKLESVIVFKASCLVYRDKIVLCSLRPVVWNTGINSAMVFKTSCSVYRDKSVLWSLSLVP